MKLGVLINLYGGMPLKDALAKVKAMGVEAVEIGAGGYPGKAHCDPKELLADPKKFEEFKTTIDESGIEVAALACHGNPIHPDKEIAKTFHDDFINAILLAEKMGVDTIVGFSGCPGDSENSKYPNWPVIAWPNDFTTILEWQWNEVLIPYWKETAAFAKAHGVTKIALEMHPGFCVYNTSTLLRLREAVGDVIGANFDPSHLIWQGMDPVACIRELGSAIYHFHAKDTKVDPINTAKNGVLDTQPYGKEITRSWIFRAVGYGHGIDFWRDIMSNLRMVGYDKVASIEHEDSLMSLDEGLSKAIASMKEAMLNDNKPADMHWV
ncbi:MAG: sugar phosphate isomerase/epimerase [Clostridiales bacterium]|nr:sugar phosphate isomerase/epimerase [Clostridiales bacterium]